MNKDLLASFKIKPNRTGALYFEVNVWRTPKAFRKHITWFKPGIHCRGTCSRYDAYNTAGRLTPALGELNLIQGWLSTEVLSHETSHAAFGYVKRKGIKLSSIDEFNKGHLSVSDAEEDFCYAQGKLMRHLVNQLYRHKLLGDG